MTTYYAIGGGNWTDTTLNGGNGLWNTAADGSGSWNPGGPGPGDIADLNGQAVLFDAVTDQQTIGAQDFPGPTVKDSVGGGSLSFTDTTSSGTPITFGDGTTFDGSLTNVSDVESNQYVVAAGGWVRFDIDLMQPVTLGDGSACVLTVSQTGTFTPANSGSGAPMIFCYDGIQVAGGNPVNIPGIACASLLDPATVSNGTKCAIPSNYSGPGGIVGNLVTPTEAQVQSGVAFGPASGLTGSLAVGGGGVSRSRQFI